MSAVFAIKGALSATAAAAAVLAVVAVAAANITVKRIEEEELERTVQNQHQTEQIQCGMHN